MAPVGVSPVLVSASVSGASLVVATATLDAIDRRTFPRRNWSIRHFPDDPLKLGQMVAEDGTPGNVVTSFSPCFPLAYSSLYASPILDDGRRTRKAPPGNDGASVTGWGYRSAWAV